MSKKIIVATILSLITLLAPKLALARVVDPPPASPTTSPTASPSASGSSSGSTKDAIRNGVNDANGGASSNSTSLSDTVKSVINLLSVAAGVIAVIMIIVGGFRYITSGGKQESVTSAKNTIVYAVIGLVVVALAQIIVHFVLNKVK